MGLIRRDFPLPALVRDTLARSDAGPVAPTRSAATVMLLRDGGMGPAPVGSPGRAVEARDHPARPETAGRGQDAPGVGETPGSETPGVEVFVMRRVATMAFAADVTVFPGGGVDARDDDPALPWRGPEPRDWADLLGVEEALARCLLVAAAREVFEECGVLLAAPRGDTAMPDLTVAPWPHLRAALVRREIAFSTVLEEHGLELRTDLLRASARWVTPEFEPRRYDTFFFVARVPSGQEPDGRTSEARTAGWARPREVLQEAAAGRVKLLPPTLVHLELLAQAPDVAAVLARDPDPIPLPVVMPRLTTRDGETVLTCEVPT